MRLFSNGNYPRLDKSIVAMGMFDGCHNGHRQVIRHAVRAAKAQNCPCLVWTYRHSPLALLAPERAPKLLQSPAARVNSLRSLGVDILCMNHFTDTIAQTPADEFLDFMLNQFGVKGIVLGHSHTFGAGAKGNETLLRTRGEAEGFFVDVIPTIELSGQPVTSSAIRAHLSQGSLRPAAAMLGRCYSLGGRIQSGRKIGRKLGYPTINVRLPQGRLLPRYGVYAAYADIDGRTWPAMVNLGIKPTVGEDDLTLEAYLLDCDEDLYGHRANIRFFQFMRDEMWFASFEELTAQIARDEVATRRIFGL